jgi:putative membrane protein
MAEIDIARPPRRTGVKHWLWLLVLMGYAGYFGYLLFSGRLEDLVSPRMTPFVVIGFVTMCVFTCVRLAALLRGPAAASLGRGFPLFLVPFALLPFSLNPNSALLSANRGISLEQGAPAVDLTTKLQAAVNPFTPKQPPEPVPKNGAIPADGPIVLSQKNYYRVYQELYSNPEAFASRTSRVTGFVYRQPGAPATRIILARELMWCCAADAVAIGFETDSASTASLKNGQWLSVVGRLATTTYEDTYTHVRSTVPLVTAVHVDLMKGPDFAFAYPS